MRVTSQLAFTHDYSKEFGGKPRLHKHYNTIIDGKVLTNFSIKWDYTRPDVYMIDTCFKDKSGSYIFVDCKSRQEAHKWIKNNRQRLIDNN